MDSEVEGFIRSLDNPLSFDPVSELGLSDAQTNRMEQFAVALRQLKDARGLRIMFKMDFWLIAQMVNSLYNNDGSPKTMPETCETFWEPKE